MLPPLGSSIKKSSKRKKIIIGKVEELKPNNKRFMNKSFNNPHTETHKRVILNKSFNKEIQE